MIYERLVNFMPYTELDREVERRLLRQRIREDLTRLNVRQRQALRLVLDGCSIDESARITKRSYAESLQTRNIMLCKLAERLADFAHLCDG